MKVKSDYLPQHLDVYRNHGDAMTDDLLFGEIIDGKGAGTTSSPLCQVDFIS
jgi:hypothetical protein